MKKRNAAVRKVRCLEQGVAVARQPAGKHLACPSGLLLPLKKWAWGMGNTHTETSLGPGESISNRGAKRLPISTPRHSAGGAGGASADVQRGSRPGLQLRALQSRLFLLSNDSTRGRDLVEPERPWPALRAPQASAPRRSSTCGGAQRLGTTRGPCCKPAPGYGSGLPGTRRHSQEVNIRFAAPTLDSF